MTHADTAFVNARLFTMPTDILWTKAEHTQYAHVDLLFQRTWMHLDDTQKILISASKRIPVSVSYRPENHLNDCIVFRLATVWRSNKGKYPPRTKTGWFANFIVELGEIAGLNLSPELAKRCIDEMDKINGEYSDFSKKI